MSQNVAFRRINGRIVPIRINDKAKGAAIAGTGLAVAGISGHIASNLVRSAAHAENEARDAFKVARKARKASEAMGPLFAYNASRDYARAGHDALKTMVESRKLFAASLKVRNIGYGIGSALVGAGVHQALKGTETEKKPKTRAAIAAGAAVATNFAIRSVFLKGINRKGMGAARAAAMAARELILKSIK